MNSFDNDPRDTAIWIPGSVVVTRPESSQTGLPAEQSLVQRALDEARTTRRSRPSLRARLKLITKNA